MASIVKQIEWLYAQVKCLKADYIDCCTKSTTSLTYEGKNLTSVYTDGSSRTVEIITELSPFQEITEGATTGIIIRGRDPLLFGDIGQNALDFSYSSSASSVVGALAPYSVAFGLNNKMDVASTYSFISGLNNSILQDTGAQGTVNTVFGTANELYNWTYVSFVTGEGNKLGTPNSTGGIPQAVGYYSFISGTDNNQYAGKASLMSGMNLLGGAGGATTIGISNIDLTTQIATQWDESQNKPNPALIIGNGTYLLNPNTGVRSNAFVVMRDGLITAPDFTIAKIDAPTVPSGTGMSAQDELDFANRVLITKEWIVAQNFSPFAGYEGYNETGTQVGNDLDITVGDTTLTRTNWDIPNTIVETHLPDGTGFFDITSIENPTNKLRFFSYLDGAVFEGPLQTNPYDTGIQFLGGVDNAVIGWTNDTNFTIESSYELRLFAGHRVLLIAYDETTLIEGASIDILDIGQIDVQIEDERSFKIRTKATASNSIDIFANDTTSNHVGAQSAYNFVNGIAFNSLQESITTLVGNTDDAAFLIDSIGEIDIVSGDQVKIGQTNVADGAQIRLYAGINGNIGFSVVNGGTGRIHTSMNVAEVDTSFGNDVIDGYQLATCAWVNSQGSTGLEALDEGNGIGWRLIGRDPLNYGNIGLNSTDLSVSSGASVVRGATGANSLAIGKNNQAAGAESFAGGEDCVTGNYSSFAYGYDAQATGDASFAVNEQTRATGTFSFASGLNTQATEGQATAMGRATIASGSGSFAGGDGNTASSYGETALGLFGTIVAGTAGTWVATDRLFGLGNGTTSGSRSDALTILKNGLATLPSVTNALIDAEPTGKAIATKEWVIAQSPITPFVQATSGGADFVVTTAMRTVQCLDTLGGVYSLAMPDAVGIAGQRFTIKNSGVGVKTVQFDPGQQADNLLTIDLLQYDSLQLESDGTNYMII